MRKHALYLVGFAALLISFTGCQTAPKTETGRANLEDEAQVALKRFERRDPTLQETLNKSVGYAIFPSVGKGGLGVGGAYGKGVLYENGRMTGFCDLSQASIGLQAGGQDYSELIVFKDPEALNNFKHGTYAMDAEVSAVAIKPGASGQAEFKKGIAVFTTTNAGLMYEASVAGQKFRTTPVTRTAD
jgi:lipid-binding SYLF domain-containing protein